jgi:hypothetical protein
MLTLLIRNIVESLSDMKSELDKHVAEEGLENTQE